jgi:hypothetical protein
MSTNKRYRDLQGNVHVLFQGEPNPTWVEVEFDPNSFPDPSTFKPPYDALRRNEYPRIEEYIDGVVKGDQAQIDAYIQKCLDIKAKYPKP